MKNNVMMVLLIILIGAAAGFGVLAGISNAVQVANFPVYEKISQLVDNQKELIRQVNEISKKIDGLSNRAPAPQAQFPPPQQPPSEDFNKVYDIPQGASVIIGKKDARVTVVKFTDLQCPYCKVFFPVIKDLLKAYPNDVRVMIKNYPLSFHPNARPAAKVALAASEQGKYIEMLDLLLDNGADVSEAKLKEYAKALGIKYDQLSNDLKSNDGRYEALIMADMDLAGKIDVRGTPTFYINGKKTRARNFEMYKQEIENILK